jgi:hypothetical protein
MLGVEDFGPLAGLPRLATLRLVGLRRAHDLGPVAALPALRRLEIAQAGIEDRDAVHVDSLRPLEGAGALEELVLDGVVVEDGGLDASVARLRAARPELAVRVGGRPAAAGGGEVEVHPPAPGIDGWWIREDLTGVVGARTNYDAEERLRAALAAFDAPLLRRLSFDTEAAAVDIQAGEERDIRAVAALIGRLARGEP